MREILFRGKRIDNGEWVEGGFYKESYSDRTHITYWNTFGLGFMDYREVSPETVGQFTGLTDKNGTKIFEGDIVRHYNHPDELERYSIGKIFWDEKHCTFRRTSKAWNAIVNIADTCVYEVIGNIHDNPELLGGADNVE